MPTQIRPLLLSKVEVGVDTRSTGAAGGENALVLDRSCLLGEVVLFAHALRLRDGLDALELLVFYGARVGGCGCLLLQLLHLLLSL